MTTPRTRPRRAGRRAGRRAAVAGLTAPLLVAVLALAGCGGSGSGDESSAGGAVGTVDGGRAAAPDLAVPPGAEPAAPSDGDASLDEKAGGGARPGTGSGLPAGSVLLRPPTSAGRSIVYTGDLVVRVDDVAAKTDRAVGLVTTAGGYLFGQRSEDGMRSADLTFKVPATRFTSVLTDLGRLGKRLSSSTAAQDVSEQVVDLRSRVTTARASVARVRALLAKATDLGQVVDIEGELTRRQADLESLEGQLAVLSDQVALSTITLHLTEVRDTPPAEDDDDASFLTGLRHGWDAFVTATLVGLTVLGAALPFLGLLTLLAALWWWGRRAVRARRAPVEGTSG